MTDTTARLALPLLASGQAQKELTHNEALTRLSFATQASVVAVAPVSVPASPAPGQCWIVGATPTGAWTGKAGHLACWTENGWRFLAPAEGFSAWNLSAAQPVSYVAGAWSTGVVRASQVRVGNLQVVGDRQGAIASPSGGTTIDAEARAAVASILSAMRNHGLIGI